MQAVGRRLIARHKAGDKTAAAIVNISSDAGRQGTVGQINYSAAKAGILGAAMSVARETGGSRKSYPTRSAWPSVIVCRRTGSSRSPTTRLRPQKNR